jgi:hypothetical protein
MVGHNSKKASKHVEPWRVLILTTEYLFDGLLQAEDDFSWLSSYSPNDTFDVPLITDVKIQPIAGLTTPVQTYAKFVLTYCAQVVALIPNDDAAFKAAQAEYEDHDQPLTAVLYAGPYVIRATILSEDGDPGTLVGTEGGFFPLKDARIDCQAPSARMSTLSIPWLLLNGGTVHGIGLE